MVPCLDWAQLGGSHPSPLRDWPGSGWSRRSPEASSFTCLALGETGPSAGHLQHKLSVRPDSLIPVLMGNKQNEVKAMDSMNPVSPGRRHQKKKNREKLKSQGDGTRQAVWAKRMRGADCSPEET